MTGDEYKRYLQRDIKEVLERYCPNHLEMRLLTSELMLVVALKAVEYSLLTSKPQEGA